MERRYFNRGPNRPAKTCSPGPQLVGEIHYGLGGSNLGRVIFAKRPSGRG